MKIRFWIFNLMKGDKKLGVAQYTDRYDLPLAHNTGTRFLLLLVGLMTFLAIISLTATFALDHITARWSSGLKYQITIEIPATTPQGELRNIEAVHALSLDVAKSLKNHPSIKAFQILSSADIQDLLEPWLGQEILSSNIPLPGLISVEMHNKSSAEIAKLSKNLKEISSDIRIEAHQDWLERIFTLSNNLKFGAFFVMTIILITTGIAVGGAIRSRMTEHRADVELLHLMGASDNYIMRQFQRHASTTAFKGSIMGALLAAALLIGLAMTEIQSQPNIMSVFALSLWQILCLVCMPLLMHLIAFITARFTVLHVLTQMP